MRSSRIIAARPSYCGHLPHRQDRFQTGIILHAHSILRFSSISHSVPLRISWCDEILISSNAVYEQLTPLRATQYPTSATFSAIHGRPSLRRFRRSPLRSPALQPGPATEESSNLSQSDFWPIDPWPMPGGRDDQKFRLRYRVARQGCAMPSQRKVAITQHEQRCHGESRESRPHIESQHLISPPVAIWLG